MAAAFKRQRGLALGIALTGAGLAGFWVPQLVAIVTEAAGWRAAYLALAGIASATAPIVWFGFRSVPQGRKPRATAAPLAGMTAAEARRTGRFWLLTIISRSEEHTSELQSLMRISYAVFCLKKKKTHHTNTH